MKKPIQRWQVRILARKIARREARRARRLGPVGLCDPRFVDDMFSDDLYEVLKANSVHIKMPLDEPAEVVVEEPADLGQRHMLDSFSLFNPNNRLSPFFKQRDHTEDRSSRFLGPVDDGPIPWMPKWRKDQLKAEAEAEKLVDEK
jgi:hypothetical protein